MRGIAPIVSFVLVIVTFIALIHSVKVSEPLQIQLFESEDLFGTWAPMVHRTHNAYLLWQESPIFSLPASLFKSDEFTIFHYAITIKLSLFFLGLWFLLLRLKVADGAALLSASFTFLIFLLFGWDNVLLSTICLVPILFVSFWNCELDGGKVRVTFSVCSVLTVILLCIFANQLSLLIVLLCFLSLFVRGKSFSSGLCVLLILIPLAHQAFFIPKTTISESYPALGRVVSDDGLVGIIRPFIGSDLPISVIDYQSMEMVYGQFSLFLAILFTALFLGLFWLNPIASRWFGIASLFAIAACLECTPYPEVRLMMPLAVLSRIVPNSFMFPLVSIAMVFSLLWALLGLWRLYHPYVVTGIYFGFSCLLFSFQVLTSSFGPGLVQIPFSDKAFNSKVMSGNNGGTLPKSILVSPSYQLYRVNGPAVVEMAAIVDVIQFSSVENMVAQVHSSHKPENARLAVDGNTETRWFSGFPGQTAKENFALRFYSPKEFDGVSLELGNFYSDFPRGIRIGVAETCDNFANGPEQTIYEAPTWQGRIMLSKDGYPYYGAQTDVKIMFGRPVKGQCVYFEQIAVSDVFEWSIAEIKFHFAG